LWSIGIFFPRFGILYQGKSGIPDQPRRSVTRQRLICQINWYRNDRIRSADVAIFQTDLIDKAGTLMFISVCLAASKSDARGIDNLEQQFLFNFEIWTLQVLSTIFYFAPRGEVGPRGWTLFPKGELCSLGMNFVP
jgi:hypothetical protein